MKPMTFLVTLIAAGAMVAGGCGKNAEQKSAEADLNEKIMKAHDAQMAKMSKSGELLGQIEAAIASVDSMNAANPQKAAGHNSGPLVSARDRLIGSRNAMESWMQSHMPYNEGIKHDQAMAQLKSDLDALMQVSEQMDTAIADATNALGEQRKFLESLASPKTRKGR